jgi:hypothetical protein
MDAYLERIFIETLKDGDFQDVDLSADNGTDGFLGGGIKVLPQLSAIGAAARVARDFDANFPSIGELISRTAPCLREMSCPSRVLGPDPSIPSIARSLTTPGCGALGSPIGALAAE